MQGNNNFKKWSKTLKLEKKLNNDERMWHSYANAINFNDDNTLTLGQFQKNNEKNKVINPSEFKS
jgi:hypothetical protein